MIKRAIALFALLLLCLAPCALGEEAIPAPPANLAAGESVQEAAIDYFSSLGISASVLENADGLLRLDLGEGRGATVFAYRSGGLEWRLENPDDALLLRWLDMRFAQIIACRSDPNETDWNKEALEGNTLLDLERYGEQALNLLLARLHAGAGDAQTERLSALLCEHILGARCYVPGGWTTGAEFAQRLVILEQQALPPVDETLLTGDPIEQLTLRAVMDYQNAYKADWNENSEFMQVVCAAHIFDASQSGDTLTVWAGVRESQYALYGDQRVVEMNGSSVPTRLTFIRSDAGWTLTEYRQPGDGTEYWPGIQAMCAGRSGLAEKMVDMPLETLNKRLESNLSVYLRANGLTAALE